LRKPRFSAGGAGGGGCGGRVTAADGVAGAATGPDAGAAGCPGVATLGAARTGPAAGGWAVCADTKPAGAVISTPATSARRPAEKKLPAHKLRGVTATPSWPAPDGQTEPYPLAGACAQLPVKFGVNMVRLRAPPRQSHPQETAGTLRMRPLLAGAAPRPDEPNEPEEQNDHNHRIEAMEEAPQGWIAVPLLAEHKAHIGQTEAPRP
jgi:hypothetical protein